MVRHQRRCLMCGERVLTVPSPRPSAPGVSCAEATPTKARRGRDLVDVSTCAGKVGQRARRGDPARETG